MSIERSLIPGSRPLSLKAKLRLSAALTVGLALLVAATVVFQYGELRRAAGTVAFSNAVVKGVSDLNSLSYSYLLTGYERARVQWNLAHGRLEKVLSGYAARTSYERTLLARISANLTQSWDLFVLLVEKTGENTRISQELTEEIAAQLMARSEIMVNDASLLGREAERRMNAVQLRSVIFILASACLLMASAVATAVFLARNITGTLDELRRGTARIAEGDFAFRLPVKRDDELGRLAMALNAMTARLQEITVSKERLEREVEERVRAEAALREARDEMERRVEERTAEIKRQSDLIDLSHEAVIIRDRESRILFWNRGAEEMYGWTRAEAMGQVIHVLLDTRWPVSFEQHMEELLRDGRWEDEIVHRRKDGSRITELSRQVLQRSAEGAVATILEINIDITERKLAEEKTKRHAAQLEASNRELQDFAFVASHDLQEPLRKIRAFGDRLKEVGEGRLDEEGLDYLERMQNAAVRMQALIRALLNYSRVTTRARPFSPTDLTTAAHEAAADLTELIRQTGGRVEIDPLATIDADATQMGQLFQNLIGNGLKFHGKENPVVRVHGSFESGEKKRGRGRFYSIEVEDNGIGFDEKYLDRIFAPFQRLHGRGAYEGTGIGLAICRKITDRHGGTITARSGPGKGSVFTVTLPVKQRKGERE